MWSFPNEYGGDDEDEILTGDGCYWSGVILLFLQQKGGTVSRQGERSARAFTPSG